MEFNKYQAFVDSTVAFEDPVYPILGLSGETGEFVELVKKAWREDGENYPDYIDTSKCTSELGDILWYVTRIASLLGISLEDVVKDNIEKLTERGRVKAVPAVRDNREVW